VSQDEATSWELVASRLKEKASVIMDEAQKVSLRKPEKGPWVILVVGVNGVGKTTSIGKLAAHFLASDKKVLLAAADTFRAAAIEQLSVWGERLGVDVIKHQAGSDPAAVAYDAVKAAMARDTDVLLIDTAGRLHAKAELMAELGKINRIIGRDLPGAPHETWLVVDATTGQNAVQQVKAFKEVVDLTGIIVTKLDGTAKGGVLIGITDQFGIPIRYIGVGEKAADLRLFQSGEYVESLF
jgi:fused signal recognition particle receptor